MVYGSNSVMGRHSQHLYAGPLIILARIGNAGAIRYSAESAWVNNNASALLPDPSVNPRWLFYKLQTMRLEQFSVGTTQQFIAVDALMSAEIEVPSRHEQDKIANVLGTLDDLVELNHRMNSTLEAMARALFQSWFVDFDPVRAKAEGRQPAGMDAETAALFPDSFEDLALGPTPKGWGQLELGSVAEIGSGRRPNSQVASRSAHASVPAYGGAGQIGWTNASLINAPVILTGRVGTLGKIMRTDAPVWPSDNTLVIQPKAGWFNQLYFALQNVDLLGLNRGSSQPLLTQQDIRRQQIIAPSPRVASQFESWVSALFKLQSVLAENSQLLGSIRDAALPKLLSGELSGSDVAA